MTTTKRCGDWIQTFTGNQFWPLDPRPEDFELTDIAHALSLICRFGGHTIVHYSVAQHSLLVSRLVPARFALEGLLHDAAEAYLADVPRPIKHQPEMLAYRSAELVIEAALAVRFELEFKKDGWPREVKYADDLALAIEKRDVMAPEPAPWIDLPDPSQYPKLLLPFDPIRVRAEFIGRAAELLGKRGQKL